MEDLVAYLKALSQRNLSANVEIRGPSSHSFSASQGDKFSFFEEKGTEPVKGSGLEFLAQILENLQELRNISYLGNTGSADLTNKLRNLVSK